jgi:hypothetical protein
MGFDPDAYLNDAHSGFDPDAYLGADSHAEAPHEGIAKGLLRSTINALPVMGGVAGSVVGAGAGLFGGPAAPVSVPLGGVAGGALGYAGGSELKDLANEYLLGEAPKADVFHQPLAVAERVGGNLMNGATYEMGGQGAAKVLEAGATAAAPYIKPGLERVGGAFNNAAERYAVKATGATGKQTEKFADDAGRQLLDRGLVKFGDSPANIAERVGAASDQAGNQIGGAIKSLDSQGVTASADDVVAQLQSRIKELAGDPSQAPLAKKLQGIVDDIIETGNSNIPISQAEQAKRGFGAKIKNWLDPESGAANKEAYHAYKGEVEKKALAADPEMAGKFMDAKQTYGLLAPIEEAASKRAATLAQSPIGGLGDTAAAAMGVIKGGPAGAAAATVGRRVLAPRTASSMAWSADKIGEFLTQSPEMFGQYAPVLQSAAQRGTQGLASTHFILQQTEPAYRALLNQVADGNN